MQQLRLDDYIEKKVTEAYSQLRAEFLMRVAVLLGEYGPYEQLDVGVISSGIWYAKWKWGDGAAPEYGTINDRTRDGCLQQLREHVTQRRASRAAHELARGRINSWSNNEDLS